MIGVAALLGLALSLQAPDQQVQARADVRPSTPLPHRIGAPTDTGVTAVRAEASPLAKSVESGLVP